MLHALLNELGSTSNDDPLASKNWSQVRPRHAHRVPLLKDKLLTTMCSHGQRNFKLSLQKFSVLLGCDPPIRLHTSTHSAIQHPAASEENMIVASTLKGYHHIPGSRCPFHNVCASRIGQITIRPLHHMRHTWQHNTIAKIGPASSMGECLPGACPARYLCIKYLISSPRFILTLGSPPSRPH